MGYFCKGICLYTPHNMLMLLYDCLFEPSGDTAVTLSIYRCVTAVYGTVFVAISF